MEIKKETPKKSSGRAKTKTVNTGKALKYGMSESDMDNFLLAFIDNGFNITKTCKAVGMSTRAYYYNVEWNEGFRKRLDWNNDILRNIVKNGMIEGLLHPDLTLRMKYLDLLAKSGVLVKLLGFDEENTEVNLKFDKNQIEFGG